MAYVTDFGPVRVGPCETRWLKWFDYKGNDFPASCATARLVLRDCERVAKFRASIK